MSTVALNEGRMAVRTSTKTRRAKQTSTLVFIALVVLSTVYMAPLLWMFSTSVKTAAQAIASPPILVPDPIVWGNYPDALIRMNFPRALMNTLIYAVPAVIFTLLSSSVVAYGFAIIKWPGRNVVFILVLTTLMLPGQVTLIPLYVTYAKLGWINTYLPLLLPSLFGAAAGSWSGPFFIFLLRQFFLGIPKDLIDAARIDGASELRILFRIVMPLSMPALITVGLLTFIDKWNDFYNPLIYLQDPKLQPLSRAVQVFQSSHKLDWPQSMAAAVVVSLPLVILYFFAQRKFIEGITLTGQKG
ncbi:MAG: carbohydrate ABC transporter permease [Hyphomicrobiaceae bacterium]|nr:carbohydrate ABC transporter permease [Hyphomicrobiaceae bacterium]